MGNFDRHVTQTLHMTIIFSTTALLAFSCCDCLGISGRTCGADCWPVSESGTENISVSDSSSEGFSWLVKNRADFGSVQNTQPLSSSSAKKRYRGKTRSSSVAAREFCSLPVRARRCRTVCSSALWKLVSCRFL